MSAVSRNVHLRNSCSGSVAIHPHPVQPDLCRLGTVVGVRGLLEPSVFERLLGRYSLRLVVDEDSLQQIQKVLQEGVAGGDDVLRTVRTRIGVGRTGTAQTDL